MEGGFTVQDFLLDPNRGIRYNPISLAGVVKLVDALDSKSSGGNPVPVRPRPPAPLNNPEQSDTVRKPSRNGGFFVVHCNTTADTGIDYSGMRPNTPTLFDYSPFISLPLPSQYRPGRQDCRISAATRLHSSGMRPPYQDQTGSPSPCL
jgi:hypothetical protein